MNKSQGLDGDAKKTIARLTEHGDAEPEDLRVVGQRVLGVDGLRAAGHDQAAVATGLKE
jgi:hypothetical protein